MNRFRLCLPLLSVVASAPLLLAQPPNDRSREHDQPRRPPAERRSPMEHLWSHDQNDDGVIEPLELVEERLRRLFGRADKDQDGRLTKQELEAEFQSIDEAESPGRPPRTEGTPRDRRSDVSPRDRDFARDRDFGPGRPPRDRDRGPDENARRQPPGPGRFGPPPFGPGGPPKPGTVMPSFIQDALELTAAQRDRLTELQKQVDDQLGQILTSEQRERLEQRQEMFRHRHGPDQHGEPKDRGSDPDDHRQRDRDDDRDERRPPPRD